MSNFIDLPNLEAATNVIKGYVDEKIEGNSEQIQTLSNDVSTLNTNKANKSTINTYTLLAQDWVSNEQTLSITGKTVNNNAEVSNWMGDSNSTAQDVLDNQQAISDANIFMITDNGTSLTFTCETTPSVNIKINVEVFD